MNPSGSQPEMPAPSRIMSSRISEAFFRSDTGPSDRRSDGSESGGRRKRVGSLGEKHGAGILHVETSQSCVWFLDRLPKILADKIGFGDWSKWVASGSTISDPFVSAISFGRRSSHQHRRVRVRHRAGGWISCFGTSLSFQSIAPALIFRITNVRGALRRFLPKT